MNNLEQWITDNNHNEITIMNLLQEYGVISDNCIMAEDVGNCNKAIVWLSCNKDKLDTTR